MASILFITYADFIYQLSVEFSPAKITIFCTPARADNQQREAAKDGKVTRVTTINKTPTNKTSTNQTHQQQATNTTNICEPAHIIMNPTPAAGD